MTSRLCQLVPSWFRELPAGQAAIAEATAADLAELRSLENQLLAIDAEEREASARLSADARDAEAKMIKAKAAFKAAEKRYVEARGASMGAASRFASRRMTIERAMRSLADNDTIDAYIARWQREHSDLRRSIRSIDSQSLSPRGEMLYLSTTNAQSVGRRLVAIVAAIRVAERLRVRAMSDVPAALDQLYAALPTVEPPAEPTPPKPAPRQLTRRIALALRQGLITEDELEEVA